MSIPLDNLYSFIHSLAKELWQSQVAVLYFTKHGSKLTEHLDWIHAPDTWKEKTLWPEIFCYDQEPLNFDMYENIPIFDERHIMSGYQKLLKIIKEQNLDNRLKNLRRVKSMRNIWDRALILHSESRSAELEKYQACQFIPIYYWSHAVIARDWFRYAQHIQQRKNAKQIFLIYNRAWSGTREYRLKFAEQLVMHDLVDHCKTTVNAVEPDTNQHYTEYDFSNQNWKPSVCLEQYFAPGSAGSHASADFEINDYEQTHIEVVLETLFDDDRLHLTEKSLRPIACGQPFILMATHGSLEYLKQYGFKTFDGIWNEDYDKIQNPESRLAAVIEVMKTISNWDHDTKARHLQQAKQVAEYNKQLFFSDEFLQKVLGELRNNLSAAFTELECTNTSADYIHWKNICHSFQEFREHASRIRSEKDTIEVFSLADSYYLRNSNHSKI